MTVSPFDHPLLSALLGDDEVSARFSAAAEIGAMVAFERALAEAEAELGLISSEAGVAIAAALDRFAPDMAALRAGTAKDGLAVPELVRQLRGAVGEPHRSSVHLGATSQDVIDTGLVLRLKPILSLLELRLSGLVENLLQLHRRFGARRLMAVTRMQAAIPITAGDRIARVAAAAGTAYAAS